MTTYQVLGVSDDKDFCQCCGKVGLKRVVFIRDTETDEVRHFGTTCAMSPAKGFGVDKQIRSAIESFRRTQGVLAAIAHREYRKAGGAYVSIDAFSARPENQALWNQIHGQVKQQHAH